MYSNKVRYSIVVWCTIPSSLSRNAPQGNIYCRGQFKSTHTLCADDYLETQDDLHTASLGQWKLSQNIAGREI